MSFTYHPDFAALYNAMLASGFTPPSHTRGDWRQMRETTEALSRAVYANQPLPASITTADYSTTSSDGAPIRLRWFTLNGSNPGSAVLYVHGGGMIMNDIDIYGPVYARYAAASGVPVLAVDFRNAPDVPGHMLAEDVFAALTWLINHAADLSIDPARIALMGDSGGGGIAAGTAILARNRGVPVAAQILLCPMLDDRTVDPDPDLVPYASWTYDENYTAWTAVLGDARGGPDVPSTIAPARETDLTGLPRTYLDTSDLDIFRDEDLAYAMNLLNAGVPVELHLYSGVPHGWDNALLDADLGRQAMANRVAALRAL